MQTLTYLFVILGISFMLKFLDNMQSIISNMTLNKSIFMNSSQNHQNQLKNSFPNTNSRRINIRTRGELQPYKLIGYLHEKNNTDDPILLPVYGTKTYSRSSKWLYYTYTDQYNKVKLPIYNIKKQNCQNEYGCDELYENDEITINAYSNTFIYKPYPKSEYRYIPY